MSTVKQENILVTGGSGLLGGELKKLLPRALFPTREEFDVADPDTMDNYLASRSVGMILHAAAFTSPPKIDADPIHGIDVNIVGTANVTKLCSRKNLMLVYLCTDYVFKGDAGKYKEEDSVHPVNKYAWSKLGGECAVRMHDPHLIIRTTFGPNQFPYPKAFVDQWTSRQTVAEIARKVVSSIAAGVTGVLHLGGNRQTVYEFAKEVSPEKAIGRLSINEVNFTTPVDTSLDTTRYDQDVEGLRTSNEKESRS